MSRKDYEYTKLYKNVARYSADLHTYMHRNERKELCQETSDALIRSSKTKKHDRKHKKNKRDDKRKR